MSFNLPPTLTPSAPAYLPLILRERCVPDQRRVDVVLVIDASSSMTEPTAPGRPKLDAAPEAEDLAGIYRAIAVAISCPAGAFRGGR